jgi:hypothetical protein
MTYRLTAFQKIVILHFEGKMKRSETHIHGLDDGVPYVKSDETYSCQYALKR